MKSTQNTWNHKGITITFNPIDNSDVNNEYHDLAHSISIHKNSGTDKYSITKNIDNLSQFIFLEEAINKIITLNYIDESQLTEEESGGSYIRKSYTYNYKLEDEYIGSHGINLERIDIEYGNNNDDKLNVETSFNISFIFYDEDEPNIGYSSVIRHLSKNDLLSLSKTISSFISSNSCNNIF